jgi:glycosyltransferase involved in cell wall biosynthesis
VKVALISSIVPRDSIGGYAVLYRHLRNAGTIDILVVSDGPAPGFPHRVVRHRIHSRILKRLIRSPLRHWASDCQEFCKPVDADAIDMICQAYAPDLIMTVAHGELWKLAAEEACRRKLPLVSLFHDWWPDFVDVHAWLRPRLDEEFRALHRRSTTSLCICPGMLAGLGEHPNAQILYPMPYRQPIFNHDDVHFDLDRRELKISYVGNLGDYGPMVQQALDVTKNHPRIRLEVRGPDPRWPLAFKQEMQIRGLWRDFVSRDEQVDQWLSSADALLVVMNFDPSVRRQMETSFPSKLVDYSQLGKPVVIWGPEYCSAIRWALPMRSALCVTSPDPNDLASALENLDKHERQRLGASARKAAMTDFNAERIQSQFLTALRTAAARGPA